MPEFATRGAGRKIGCTFAASLVGVGLLLLVMGATRQYRDLHRLQLLGLGYFCTGVGGFTALALAVGPRGRRVLAGLAIATGAAVAITIGVLVIKARTHDHGRALMLDGQPHAHAVNKKRIRGGVSLGATWHIMFGSSTGVAESHVQRGLHGNSDRPPQFRRLRVHDRLLGHHLSTTNVNSIE